MYKNQLQELAQRSCFNLPSYSCIREGPDHAPRFKATVNFNGETFESPAFYSTLRLAEHAAAEVALSTVAERDPLKSLATRVLDETGVCKNMLQEAAHRAGLNLPVYTTLRAGPVHFPVFSCTIELAGLEFAGEQAKTKKQAQKNAAMVAWSELKQMSQCGSSSSSGSHAEQEQVIVARFLSTLLPCKSAVNPATTKGSSTHKNSSRTCSGLPRAPSVPNSSYYENQSRAPSSLSPDLATYHMWLQERAIVQQNHPFTLMVPPPAPGSQFFPLMNSIPQPSYHPNSIMTGYPPFHLLNQVDPFTSGPRSQVTSQEVKLQEISNPSVSTSCSRNEAAENGMFAFDDDKREACLVETQVGHSRLVEGDPGGPLRQGLQEDSYLDGRIQSNNAVSQNPPKCTPSISRSDPRVTHGAFRPRHTPPLQIADRIIQFCPRQQALNPTVPPYLTNPWTSKMQTGGLPSRFMAPAVQVRSVAPVCSAPPPPKKMTGSLEERPTRSEVNNSRKKEEISVMKSNLDKLQL